MSYVIGKNGLDQDDSLSIGKWEMVKLKQAVSGIHDSIEHQTYPVNTVLLLITFGIDTMVTEARCSGPGRFVSFVSRGRSLHVT